MQAGLEEEDVKSIIKQKKLLKTLILTSQILFFW